MNVRALFAQAPYGPKVRALGRTQVLTSPAMADIRQQLATLLNKEATDIGDIRKTGETPPRVSIYDVVSAITGMDGNHAGKAYRDLQAGGKPSTWFPPGGLVEQDFAQKSF